MFKNDHADDRGNAAGTNGSISAVNGREKSWKLPQDSGKPPRLRIRKVLPAALVRFVDAEILFEESAIRAIGQQLHDLVRDQGPTRLVVNFTGVRYVSSEILGILASIQREIEKTGGQITLCGLHPLLRDMLRITHLDGLFDVCEEELDALGFIDG